MIKNHRVTGDFFIKKHLTNELYWYIIVLVQWHTNTKE